MDDRLYEMRHPAENLVISVTHHDGAKHKTQSQQAKRLKPIQKAQS